MDVFGTIINSTTGDPVPFVNVAARNALGNFYGKGTQSDINGIFDLRGINATDTVQFSAIGYRTSVPLLREVPAQNTVMLEPQSYDVGEVVITDTVPTRPKTTIRLHALDAVAIALLIFCLAYAGYNFFINR
jgi:hypothetical protein